jgi:hypothetical protein
MQHWMIFVFTKYSFGIFFYRKGGLWSESFSLRAKVAHRFRPTVLIIRYRSTYYTYNVARETKITRSMLLDAMFPVDMQRGVCG